MENKKEQAPANGAKLELVYRFTLPDGRVVEKMVDTGIPAPDEFDITDKDRFLTTFDRFERSVIDARDRLAKSIGKTMSEELKKTAEHKE